MLLFTCKRKIEIAANEQLMRHELLFLKTLYRNNFSIFYANYVLKGHFTNSTHEIQSTKQSVYCKNICIMSSVAVNDE